MKSHKVGQQFKYKIYKTISKSDKIYNNWYGRVNLIFLNKFRKEYKCF